MATALDAPLGPLTTLGVGGPARRLATVESEDELVALVREADAAAEPVLVLAGGSNVVIADAGFDGLVIRIATRGVERRAVDGGVELSVAAGEPWDALVAETVAGGLAGFECLAGIPGSTGATPIQNVGAYGQEVAETIATVRVLDRRSGAVSDLPASACGFRYRTSVFKGSADHVVLGATFVLERSDTSRPIRYAELARTLGVEREARAPLADVRAAVLALRRGKGMVIDPDDPDTRSAGSFFTNPIVAPEAFAHVEAVAAERAPAGRRPPGYPEADGRVKTSAAWLIEAAGFHRGHARGRAAISSKHTLALVNRGGASTEELVALAREVADGVAGDVRRRAPPRAGVRRPLVVRG